MNDDGCRVLLTFAGLKTPVVVAMLRSPEFAWVGAVDADPGSVVREAASFFEAVPTIDDRSGYLASLERICRAERVDCIVSLNDRDIVTLADHADRFLDAGVRVLGVSPPMARLFEDKLETSRWLRDRGVSSPPTWLPTEARAIRGRWVVKARFGQGSAGYRVLDDGASLPGGTDDLVVQPLVGGDEFVLDVLRDPSGAVAVIPKKRIAERDGDMVCGVFVEDDRLVALGEELAGAAGLVGAMDVDVVRSGDADHVLDINPRIGGGFPFTAVMAPSYVDALGAVGAGRSATSVRVVERRPVHREGDRYVARAAISE